MSCATRDYKIKLLLLLLPLLIKLTFLRNSSLFIDIFLALKSLCFYIFCGTEIAL
jgi:hypothetical protein